LTEFYVDPKKLYYELSKYYIQKKNGVDPQINNYIGKSIEDICKGIGSRPNFAGYSYIQDMIRDGVLHCVAAVPKFNPEKSKNPFGYFSMICWRAFLQRIAEEKKQNAIKHKNHQNMHMFDQVASGSDKGIGDITNSELSNKVIAEFEEKLTKTKKGK
jgi:hypothetical protein